MRAPLKIIPTCSALAPFSCFIFV